MCFTSCRSETGIILFTNFLQFHPKTSYVLFVLLELVYKIILAAVRAACVVAARASNFINQI